MSRSGSQRGSRLVRLAFLAGAGGIALFHVWLLGARLLDLSLFQPGNAVRWGASVLLVEALRRAHRSVAIDRRKLLVLWLLVAVLHAFAAVPVEVPDATAIHPAPLIAVTVLLGGIGAFAWWLLHAGRIVDKRVLAVRGERAAAEPRPTFAWPGFWAPAGCRAPPA